MHSFQFEKAPRPWEILEAGRVVRVGASTVPLAAVAGVRRSEVYEPNVTGHLMAVGLFMLLGCVFLVPVLMSMARGKFAAGAVLFIGIGLTALGEVRRLRAIHLHRVEIDLNDGRRTVFTTPHRGEAEALAAVLSVVPRMHP